MRTIFRVFHNIWYYTTRGGIPQVVFAEKSSLRKIFPFDRFRQTSDKTGIFFLIIHVK